MFRTKIVEKSKSNLFLKKYSVFEIMWKNIVQPGRPQMTIWCMRIACWIPKATNTHSYYVMLIAFPRQKWLRERTLVLLYTYITRLITELERVYYAVRAETLRNFKELTNIFA
jgi:hypothetical protein